MKVEDIKFYPINGGGTLKAIFSFSLGGKITFHSWKVIDASKGLFIAAPSQEKNGKYFSLVFINDVEMRDELQETILEAYEKWAEEETPPAKKESKFKSKKRDNGLPF